MLLKGKRHAGLGAQQSAKLGELTKLGPVWSRGLGVPPLKKRWFSKARIRILEKISDFPR